MAQYTNKSQLSRITRTMSFPMYTQDEFDKRLLAWKKGHLLIQEAFPEISPGAREFIKTGITDDEWNNTFNNMNDKESAMEKWTDTNEIFF